MRRWLTLQNANRAAWLLMGTLVVGALVFGAALLVQRVRSGGSGPQAETATDEVGLDAPPATASAVGVPAMISGEIGQVQGEAFLLHSRSGRDERVLVRGGAVVQLVAVSRGAQALQLGDPIALPAMAPRREIGALVNDITVAPLPEQVEAERCSQVGTVTAVEGNSVTYQSRCGEQRIGVSPGVRIARVAPATAADLHEGQSVALTVVRLADGTLAASSVQIRSGR